MTITPALIYWINTIDQLGDALGIILICAAIGIFTIGFIMFMATVEDEPDRKEKNLAKLSLIKRIIKWSILIIILGVFLPSKQTMYEMIIVPAAANSKLVQSIPDYIQKYLDELTKADKK